MLENNVQLCLSTYFDYEYIFGASRAVYDVLCDVYFVDKAVRDDVFARVSSERVASVESFSLYKRYMRIMSARAAAGDCFDEIINVKSRELAMLEELKMPSRKNSTVALSCTSLYNGAGEGRIIFLRLLGILQCAGVSVTKNVALGIKNLTKAARWNDAGATLALLAFDAPMRKKYLDMLYTQTLETENAKLYGMARAAYGGDGRVCQESKLIAKLMCAGKIKRDGYDVQVARVVYSGMLSLADRRKLVYSDNRKMLADTCELPLDLKGGAMPVDPSALGALPLVRREERERIATALGNNDLRALDGFKPLCVCSDCEYLLEMYAAGITDALGDANVVRFDVGDLVPYDLDASTHNIFISSCDESANNAYLLFFTGDVDDDVAGAVVAFLNERKRRNVRLVNPDVTLDFGAILPVCFCDTANLYRLRGVTDTVKLAPVAAAERGDALDDLVARKAALFGLDSLTLEPELYESLRGLGTDDASALLDDAIRANRQSGGALALTRAAVRDVSGHDAIGCGNGGYGFGGAR